MTDMVSETMKLEVPAASGETPDLAKAAKRGDDKAMLKAAATMTRDLNRPDARIYWADLILSVVLGYGALALCIVDRGGVASYFAGVVAVLALYRAGSFIHELAHIKKGDLPYFRLVWNALVGVPLLAPSFMYEGVHNQHHAKTKYGTIEDPEYLPLASMKPWSLPLFLIFAALAPVLLLGRFAILAPLSAISPWVRKHVVGRYSGLQINPHFIREKAEGVQARNWRWQEIAATVWAISLIALMATGILPIREFLIVLGVMSGVMFLNQVRTLVAHLWENESLEPMSVTDQYLDSVNVPPPGTLPALWAPVGLRYHALHHLLPGVPYHNLGEAHRRLSAELEGDSAYHASHHRALLPLVTRIARSTMKRAA